MRVSDAAKTAKAEVVENTAPGPSDANEIRKKRLKIKKLAEHRNASAAEASKQRDVFDSAATSQNRPADVGGPSAAAQVNEIEEIDATARVSQTNQTRDENTGLVRKTIGAATLALKGVYHLLADDLTYTSQYKNDFTIVEKLNKIVSASDLEQGGESSGGMSQIDKAVSILQDAQATLNQVSDRHTKFKSNNDQRIQNAINQLNKLKPVESRTPSRVAGALQSVFLVPAALVYEFDVGSRLRGREPENLGSGMMTTVAKAPLTLGRIFSASQSPIARADTHTNNFLVRMMFDTVNNAVRIPLNLADAEPRSGSTAELLTSFAMTAVLTTILLLTQAKDFTGDALNVLSGRGLNPVANQTKAALEDPTLPDAERQRDRELIEQTGRILAVAQDFLENMVIPDSPEAPTNTATAGGIENDGQTADRLADHEAKKQYSPTESEFGGASRHLKGRMRTAKSNIQKSFNDMARAVPALERSYGAGANSGADTNAVRKKNSDVGVKAIYAGVGLGVLIVNTAMQRDTNRLALAGEIASTIVTGVILGQDVANKYVDQRAMSEQLASWVGYASVTAVLNSVFDGQVRASTIENEAGEVIEAGTGFLTDTRVALGTGAALAVFGSPITKLIAQFGAFVADKVGDVLKRNYPDMEPEAAFAAAAERSVRGESTPQDQELNQTMAELGDQIAATTVADEQRQQQRQAASS